MAGQIRVVATAGHVDHGKSTLIRALTGIEPDRWDQEKRRGLTIDLGFAWCTLPSGRDVGFVDVPGHRRFITNMLAGVGPAPTVLFVVAADEGWKPQSEEHLAILDVLGVGSGVVALTKTDTVPPDEIVARGESLRERLRDTTLDGAAIVPVCAATGEGLDALRGALDLMLDAAPVPPPARPRLFVDRVFTIKGSGTVVTGTLTGGCIAVGEDVQLQPGATAGRVRSLQTHRTAEDLACPVSRVAANLAGVDRHEAARGDVLGPAGAWQPSEIVDAQIRPVRGLERPIGPRGAYKVYAGAAEVDATLRFFGTHARLEPNGHAFVRIRPARPLVVDPFDRIVIREAGRRETVAGGIVLDTQPPRRAGPDRVAQLTARAGATREDLNALMAAERGAVRAGEAALATGCEVTDGPDRWLLRAGLATEVKARLTEALADHHRDHALDEGLPLDRARRILAGALREASAPRDADLVDELLARAVREGTIATSATTVRLDEHRVRLDAHREELERLLTAIGGENRARPPTLEELESAGVGREVIDAAARADQVVKIAPNLVVLPALLDEARALVAAAPDGITVSAFREALGTTRKYAVPLLGYLDRIGVTRREGDLRFVRTPAP